jgi:ABC-type dipeptide/oligopeptide/nickel transport system permease component
VAGPGDHGGATAVYSVPSIVLAALLWTFVAHKWGWFPDGGYVKLRTTR